MSPEPAGLDTVKRYLSGMPKALMIDGAWVPAASGRTFESINPCTGEVLTSLAMGSATDIDLAVAAARRAFDGPWQRFTPTQRQNAMLRLADLVDSHYDELGLLDVLDMGAPVGRYSALQSRAVETLRYYAGWATKLYGDTVGNSVPADLFTYTLREPVGVVGAIMPWNGPLIGAIQKIAPVLATGCTVVLKPAEEACISPLRLAELVLESGIPDGVVNIVTGFGEAGAALAAHPDVDKIAFTGSHFTGREIVKASAGNMKRLSLELGGKSPDIVFADADLDKVIPGAAMGVFANSGQICLAGSRLFVQSSIYDEVVEGIGRYASALKIGDSLDPTTDLGPIVSLAQLERVVGYLESGREEGARVVSGGQRIGDEQHAQGYFVEPTIFADADDSMKITEEEIFGPVITALRFDDVDEVIRRANATCFGLGGGIWTNNLGRAHSVAGALRTGNVWVNCYGMADPALPFGGYKMSGYGKEKGRESLDEYLQTKSVWIRTS